jgi:hypothetical protein
MSQSVILVGEDMQPLRCRPRPTVLQNKIDTLQTQKQARFQPAHVGISSWKLRVRSEGPREGRSRVAVRWEWGQILTPRE